MIIMISGSDSHTKNINTASRIDHNDQSMFFSGNWVKDDQQEILSNNRAKQ